MSAKRIRIIGKSPNSGSSMIATSDDRYANLSPFELKDRLVALATECTRASARLLLDAGRANPDWLALEPRDAFVELERFALGEALLFP